MKELIEFIVEYSEREGNIFYPSGGYTIDSEILIDEIIRLKLCTKEEAIKWSNDKANLIVIQKLTDI